MLSLDSPEWYELSHAYGGAFEVPRWLRELEANPSDPLWETIWSSLCHQYTVYSATYAAVPHIVAIAEQLPPSERIDHWIFVGTVATHADGDFGPYREDYLNAVSRVCRLINEDLDQRPLSEMHAAYLIAALAGTVGARGIARTVYYLADRMVPGSCPKCGTCVSVDLDSDPGTLSSYPPHSWERKNRTDLRLAPLPPETGFDPSRSRDDNAASWLPAIVRKCGHAKFENDLRMLYGTATCPECRHVFVPLPEFAKAAV